MVTALEMGMTDKKLETSNELKLWVFYLEIFWFHFSSKSQTRLDIKAHVTSWKNGAVHWKETWFKKISGHNRNQSAAE